MDQTLALQGRVYVPETLRNHVPEAKRTKEIIKEKAKDLLKSLNIVELIKNIKKEGKKLKNLLEEYSNLDEKNKKLSEDFNKTATEIEKLMPAFRVQK
ncbi:MAG: hypothetical protein WC010_00055 [Candidatus Absconditabacterales bacterium]